MLGYATLVHAKFRNLCENVTKFCYVDRVVQGFRSTWLVAFVMNILYWELE